MHMNRFQKIIAGILMSILFYMPASAAEQIARHRDTFWGNTSVGAQQQLADMFPNARNLDEILLIIQGAANNNALILGALDTAALGIPSSGVPLTDIGLVAGAVNPLSPDLGTAVQSAITLTGSNSLNPPVPHTNLVADLTAVQTAVGPGANLGASVAADLTLIGVPNLIPVVPTTNTINGDLIAIKGKIKAAAPTLGNAINDELALIGLLASSTVIDTDLLTIRASLGPLATTLFANIAQDLQYINTAGLPLAPPSSNVIYNDLVTTKNYINPAALVPNLGAALTTEFGYIATALLPTNPASTNNIHGDLALVVGRINGTSVTLGGSVTFIMGLLGVPSLIPPVPTTNTLDGDIVILRNAIRIGAPNIGAAIYQAVQAISPPDPDINSAVTSILNQIGTNALIPPIASFNIIRSDIGAMINAIFFGAPSLGSAFQQYRQALLNKVATNALVPPVASTNNVSVDIDAIINAMGVVAPTLGAAVALLGAAKIADCTKIGTANLAPPVPTTNVVSTDLDIILGRMTNPALASVGGAITAILNMIVTGNLNPPVLSSNNIGQDLGVIIPRINPLAGNLGGAINANLALIDTQSLFPAVPTSGVESTDIQAIIQRINPAVLTLGFALTTTINRIDTVNLTPPIPSVSIIFTDLIAAIGRVNPTANITFGTAVTTELNFISTASLPGFPPTSGVIDTDLGTARNAINPLSANLGSAVSSTYVPLGPVNVNLINTINGLLGRLNAYAASGNNFPATGPFASIDLFLINRGF
jgi:hypothetical protein